MRRVLIDECINPRLAPRLRSGPPVCSVETVGGLGWTGQKDHVLVLEIEGRFDVFVTIDKGFEFEHDLKKLSFAIIVLTTANNQMPSYERLLEELFRQIERAIPGHVVHVIDPDCRPVTR
jgi:predicted nuclease of predicted toxin-antitoxin system